jgi:hypothetical protein
MDGASRLASEYEWFVMAMQYGSAKHEICDVAQLAVQKPESNSLEIHVMQLSEVAQVVIQKTNNHSSQIHVMQPPNARKDRSA